VLAAFLLSVVPLFADISLTDKSSTIRIVADSKLTPTEKQAIRDANKAKRDAKKKGGHSFRASSDGSRVTPVQKQQLRDANKAKRDAKRSRTGKPLRASSDSFSAHADATGSVQLIDSAGLKYFINTNITFSTSSSASGAASEASYTNAIVASTSGGGTTTSTLSDMFDGYNGLCVSLTNATGPCQTGNANYTMYEKNGAASVDATVPAVPACTNRQYILPAQTIGGLSVRRKVYVPPNDRYIRWTNLFTNTTGAPITFTMITSNNLGSDSNTRIVSSSSGDNVATVTDLWVSTFQNYSGNTSSDPRIGHVLQGTGAPTPVSNINFADGDDNPYWVYSITLAAGQTKSIVNYATGQGTKAAANTQAANLAAFGANAQQCFSNTELAQIVNFASSADLSIVKTASVVTNVNAGQSFSYNLAVTNNGPSSASAVSVSDVLPAGVTFVSAFGTGWTCNQSLGTVTCTMPTLAVGPANPITINVTAPSNAGALANTATVSSSTSDPTPANNTSTNNLTVVASANLSITKTASTSSVQTGGGFFYTIQVNNAGPSAATAVSVSDTLPATVNFVSASGTGWTCGQAAGTVTCTIPTLAVGAANPITINVTASTTTTGNTGNTATVTSTTPDPTPGNNTSAAAAVSIVTPIPMLDPKQLALLAVLLGAAALLMMRRSG
jgi:uncharacterized repeat protein (TIGR01451 family)